MSDDEVIVVARIESCVVGDDVGRSRDESHWFREIHLLPAVSCFISKLDGGEQRTCRAPKISYVRAGVHGVFIEPDAHDRTSD